MAKLLYSEEEAMTPGERFTASILGDGLPDHWTVICNKMFTSNHGPTREIDFIVIGDGSIILIDEKSWRGRITGSDQIWSREDGSSHYNPLNKLDRTVRMMVGHLRDRVPHLDQIPEYIEFAIGCVLLTISAEKPRISHDIDPRLDRQVFLLKDAVTDIIALDESGWTEGVAKARTDIIDVLWQIKSRPKSPAKINEFEIIETLPSPPYPEITRYLSRHPDDSSRVLTVYELTSLSDVNRQFYLREYEALKSLGEAGLTPDVDLWFEWSDGQFLVVPNKVPEGTSYGALRSPETRADVIEELYISAAIYSALNRMHAKGIVHRALGLENIYLIETDDGYGVTFTGLWAARQRDSYTGTISHRLDEIREGAAAEDPAAAPEIYHGYEFADETSDTYAVSIMLLSRLSGVRLENLRDGTGQIIVSNSWELWRKVGADIAAKLISFFGSTLGADPAIGSENVVSGRKSAEYCELDILEIISKANALDNDDGFSSPMTSDESVEPIIPVADIDEPDDVKVIGVGPADAGAGQEVLSENDEGFRLAEEAEGEPEADPEYRLDVELESELLNEPDIEENDSSDKSPAGEVKPTPTESGNEHESSPGTKALPQEQLFLRHGSIRLQIIPEGISIGRSADNALPILDDYVSNNHAQVVLENGRCVLKDVGSRNGTYIHDERIEHAVLHPGDVIKVGRTDIFVESEFPSAIDISSWKITLLSGPQDRSEIKVSEGTTSIGRGVDNDIVLTSRSISRVHADLILDSDGFAIEDRGSTNGTFVNSSRVSFCALKDGDIIKMGDTKLRVTMVSN